MEYLEELCLLAHEQALATGNLTPAEKVEFMSLPMKLVSGIPVFDRRRMRTDQEEELIDRLVATTAPRRARDVASTVIGYMRAYGRFGLRLRDVMEHVAATKPIVLKALRDLMEDGKVRMEEEMTRGQTGSRRKRYFWTANQDTTARRGDAADTDEEYGMILTDGRGPRAGDSGIFYHGTSVQGVSCPCGSCRQAAISALDWEASHDR